jgi:hypothetical protein
MHTVSNRPAPPQAAGPDGHPVTTLTDDRTAATPTGTGPPLITPAVRAGRRGDRLLGAYVRVGDEVRFVPAYDVDRLVTGVFAALAAVAAGAAVAGWARRPGPAVRTVTMGPGGWVSFKGVPGPPLRPTRPRPWWARVLRAHRLVVQR